MSMIARHDEMAIDRERRQPRQQRADQILAIENRHQRRRQAFGVAAAETKANGVMLKSRRHAVTGNRRCIEIIIEADRMLRVYCDPSRE